MFGIWSRVSSLSYSWQVISTLSLRCRKECFLQRQHSKAIIIPSAPRLVLLFSAAALLLWSKEAIIALSLLLGSEQNPRILKSAKTQLPELAQFQIYLTYF